MARNDTPRSFRFQPEEAELLDRMAKKHGSAKAAVVAGLIALEGKKDPTKDTISTAVAAELEKMAKAIREAMK